MQLDIPINPPFSIGQVAKFSYPRFNDLNSRRQLYSPRVVHVTEVRDMRASGLHPDTILRRPTKARGRWLITGICLDSMREKSFYWESMQGSARDTWLSFGLYDVADDASSVLQIGVYPPTVSARQFMASVVSEFRSQVELAPEIDFTLGIFPVDAGAEFVALTYQSSPLRVTA